jgi:hypothetical protein
VVHLIFQPYNLHWDSFVLVKSKLVLRFKFKSW